MKLMGLDYGSKTVGVAISDDLLFTAHPVETIKRESENKLRRTLARIESLVSENHVQKIILGLPLLPDGNEGERAEKTREFKTMLEKRTGLEVILVDERFTTDASIEELKEMGVPAEERKTYVDQLAACHILDDYLNQLSNNKNPEEG
ncbi:MAG: Holliday junction resolvase RuvX [Parasporobacterium sp.]|nr:Holliday junction resolvase RuvX [Parasporobacterium sp.]